MILNRYPQVPPGRTPWTLGYQTDGDALTITLRKYRHGEPAPGTGERPVEVAEKHVDTFDFSGTPDGRLDMTTLQTTLPVQPVLAAERVDGVLTVTVLDWSGTDG